MSELQAVVQRRRESCDDVTQIFFPSSVLLLFSHTELKHQLCEIKNSTESRRDVEICLTGISSLTHYALLFFENANDRTLLLGFLTHQPRANALSISGGQPSISL